MTDCMPLVTIFREEATSVLAGFHAGLFWLNWNLEVLVFVEVGKPENPEKNPRNKARTNHKLHPRMTRVDLEPGPHWRGKRSHNHAIPALLVAPLSSV